MEQAWHYLGPDLREHPEEPGSMKRYILFWSTIEDVSIVDGPRAVGGHLVEVQLDFTVQGKGVIRETHRLGMIVEDGRILINTDEVLSITELDGPDDDDDDDDDSHDEDD